jgi:hypothetical protein
MDFFSIEKRLRTGKNWHRGIPIVQLTAVMAEKVVHKFSMG